MLIATVTRHPTQTNHGQAIFGHQSGMNQPNFQSACLNSPRKSAPTSNAGSATLHRISTDVMPRIIAMTFASSRDRKSTRLNSSHSQISYAVFCLQKKKNTVNTEASLLV